VIFCIHISGIGGCFTLGDLRRKGIQPHTIPVADDTREGGLDYRADDWQLISVVDVKTTAEINGFVYAGVSQDGTAHILVPSNNTSIHKGGDKWQKE